MTTAAEELFQGRNAQKYRSLIGLKEDDFDASLMPYFLRLLAGMSNMLLLVTVAVSVITRIMRIAMYLEHLDGAWSDAYSLRETNAAVDRPLQMDDVP